VKDRDKTPRITDVILILIIGAGRSLEDRPARSDLEISARGSIVLIEKQQPGIVDFRLISERS
jgi:hypothetical protein